MYTSAYVHTYEFIFMSAYTYATLTIILAYAHTFLYWLIGKYIGKWKDRYFLVKTILIYLHNCLFAQSAKR